MYCVTIILNCFWEGNHSDSSKVPVTFPNWKHKFTRKRSGIPASSGLALSPFPPTTIPHHYYHMGLRLLLLWADQTKTIFQLLLLLPNINSPLQRKGSFPLCFVYQKGHSLKICLGVHSVKSRLISSRIGMRPGPAFLSSSQMSLKKFSAFAVKIDNSYLSIKVSLIL